MDKDKEGEDKPKRNSGQKDRRLSPAQKSNENVEDDENAEEDEQKPPIQHHGSQPSLDTKSEDTSRLYHTSKVGQAQYDYVMSVSKRRGREILLKNKIQEISLSQHHPSRTKSDQYEADGETEDDDENESAFDSTESKVRTLQHHTRMASLYGPLPPHERAQLARLARTAAMFSFRSMGPVNESSSTIQTTKSIKSKGSRKRIAPGVRSWAKTKCARLSDISEDDRLEAQGEWDYWKGFYCGDQSQYKKCKHESLSWAIMFVLGQCGFMELVHYIHKWGTSFMVVAALFSLALGFPMYIVESGAGQYSGRKPLQMLRYLCPALSGLGVLFYLRTLLLAIRALGIFLYSTYFAMHFLSCSIQKNNLLEALHNQSLTNASFPAGQFTIIDINNEYNIPIMSLLLVSFWIFGFYSLNKFGRLFRVVTRILTVILFIYFVTIYFRYIDARNAKTMARRLIDWKYYNNTFSDRLRQDRKYGTESIWTPLWQFMEFRPLSLLSGQIWIDAIVYAVNSLVLGTLVHPYLNSRSAFHYRSGRDGFMVILYSLFINFIVVASVVLWVNYIAPNKRHITTALENLSGPYGILIVYAQQHHQGYYTGKMETDILFWAGMFYASLGICTYLAVNGYIHVLTHCSYQESTSGGVKLVIFFVVCVTFTVMLPVLFLCKEGLQHLIFLDFYTNRCMILVVFTAGAYFWAVAYGHGLHKFVYDFRNMMHYEMFRAAQVSARYPKWARFTATVAIGATLVYSAFLWSYPVAGNTDYSGIPSHIANTCSLLLCCGVVAFAYVVERRLTGYTGRVDSNKRSWRPHRDWYKNRYHFKSCFIVKPDEKMKEGAGDEEMKKETPSKDKLWQRRKTSVSFAAA